MIEALPRYCLQCNTPLRKDMQHCTTCGLLIEAMMPGRLDNSPETNKYNTMARQKVIASQSGYLQQEENGLLPDYQSSWSAPEATNQTSRFLPASPLPLEPGEWNEPDDQDVHQCWCTQQDTSLVPEQPQIGEQWDHIELANSPSEPASLESKDLPTSLENGQGKAGESKDIALTESVGTTLGQPGVEEKQVLPPSPGMQDYQLPWQAPDEPFQPPRLFPTVPPLSEPGGWDVPKRQRRRDIFFIALVAFLLLASGGYIVVSRHLSDVNDANRALNIQANATRVANANPYVPGSTLTFSDTLKAASPNWEQDAGCAFKEGGYHVISTTIQSCMLNTSVIPADFVLEFKMTLLHGDVGGLFFRQDKLYNRNNGYLLDFDSKGNYQLWNYSISSTAQMLGSGVSDHFRTGYNQPNKIALVVQGSNITLYINGQMVRHFADSTYSIGSLSLISSGYSNHTGISETTYSDLRLWQL